MTIARQRLGRHGEDLALDHLRRRGFELVARNHRTRFGEIDLVVADDATLVVCEVKTRRAGWGHPLERLDPAKQRQVRRMGSAFLAEVADRPWRGAVRFDAIGVVVGADDALLALDHLEGAF